MDICDRAQQIEEAQRDDALRQQRRAGAHLSLVSALFCQNSYCGEEIPEARREAIPGVQLCIDCQKLKERGKLR